MRLIVFSDIDDTLMQTARKCSGMPGLQEGATSKDGSPGSFTTEGQRLLWTILAANAHAFVPVTARSLGGLHRVRPLRPFKDGAVIDFGAGVLNPDGSFDAEWTAKLTDCADAAATQHTLEVLRNIVAVHWPMASDRIAICNGVPAYLLMRPENSAAVETIAQYLRDLINADSPGQFYLHVTGRDVCVLPAHVNKGSATQYLCEKNGWTEDLVIGAGDSLSDMAFLKNADFLLVPGNSRIASHLAQAATTQMELL